MSSAHTAHAESHQTLCIYGQCRCIQHGCTTSDAVQDLSAAERYSHLACSQGQRPSGMDGQLPPTDCEHLEDASNDVPPQGSAAHWPTTQLGSGMSRVQMRPGTAQRSATQSGSGTPQVQMHLGTTPAWPCHAQDMLVPRITRNLGDKAIQSDGPLLSMVRESLGHQVSPQLRIRMHHRVQQS